MKTCAKCKKEKSFSEFSTHKRDGYRGRCKTCSAEDTKDYKKSMLLNKSKECKKPKKIKSSLNLKKHYEEDFNYIDNIRKRKTRFIISTFIMYHGYLGLYKRYTFEGLKKLLLMSGFSISYTSKTLISLKKEAKELNIIFGDNFKPIQGNSKTCTKCNNEKPFSEFYSSKKLGLKARCKSCEREDRAKYRETHPVIIKAYRERMNFEMRDHWMKKSYPDMPEELYDTKREVIKINRLIKQK